MNLNHQKVRVPGEPVRCRLCGAHFDETIQGICPARVVRFAAPQLLEPEQEPEEGWALGELQEEANDATRHQRKSLMLRPEKRCSICGVEDHQCRTWTLEFQKKNDRDRAFRVLRDEVGFRPEDLPDPKLRKPKEKP